MVEVVVRGSAAGFAQEILAGRHPLTADESKKLQNLICFEQTSPQMSSPCFYVDTMNLSLRSQMIFRRDSGLGKRIYSPRLTVVVPFGRRRASKTRS
jgi:hypothetical protein